MPSRSFELSVDLPVPWPEVLAFLLDLRRHVGLHALMVSAQPVGAGVVGGSRGAGDAPDRALAGGGPAGRRVAVDRGDDRDGPPGDAGVRGGAGARGARGDVRAPAGCTGRAVITARAAPLAGRSSGRGRWVKSCPQCRLLMPNRPLGPSGRLRPQLTPC